MSTVRCWNCRTVYEHPPRKIKWRGDAQKYYMTRPAPPGYGIPNRVYDIAYCFISPERDEYSPEVVKEVEDEEDNLVWKEGLLDELQAYDVESIDAASLLHSKDCLFSFLRHVLSNKHSSIRAKAADVITTMVQNHPTSQQLVIEGNGIQLLFHNFTSYHDDATSRIKTLGAISALIRNNKSGIKAFRLEKGFAALRDTFFSGSDCQREIFNLCQYLLHEKRKRKEGQNQKKMKRRRRKGGNSGQLVQNDDKLKQVFQGLLSAATPIVQSNSPRPKYGIADRVYDIAGAGFLVEDGEDLEWMQGCFTDLLDELQVYDYEYIDVASVLHSKDCLFSFLRDVLSNEHSSIRSIAAEVVTTMVQNHPTSQQLLIEERCLQLLLYNFTSDPDVTSRTKALGAISSLIRNNKSGITAFRLEKGYAALKNAFISGSVCQREILNLCRYLLHEKREEKKMWNQWPTGKK